MSAKTNVTLPQSKCYYFSNTLTRFQHTSALHQDSSLGLNPGESRMYLSLSELTGVTWKELQEFDWPGLVSALSSLVGLQSIMASCWAAPEQRTTRFDH